MRYINKIFVGILLSSAFIFSFGGVTSAAFEPFGAACSDELNASNATLCEEQKTGQNGENPVSGEDGILTRVINILATVVAVIAVIVIIVAGMTMTLSGGDSGKVQSSRDAIIYAAVGLVVAGLARAFVILVINKVE